MRRGRARRRGSARRRRRGTRACREEDHLGEDRENHHEQTARDAEQTQRRLNAEAAHDLEMRRAAAERSADGWAWALGLDFATTN